MPHTRSSPPSPALPSDTQSPDTAPLAATTDVTIAHPSAWPAPQGVRYTFHDEIGRGGMGEVVRGRDVLLRRELAVKVLPESFRDQADVVQRFLDEAQIAGQLQHPGIVPVYDAGLLADGRPFFAMKLVKGRTLSEMLRKRSDPSEDLPQLLKIFEHVCQTMAYAHSRRVIHRDLKPGNVMVGAFGEVLVMDWGVAKVLGAETAPEEQSDPGRTEIRTARSSDPHDQTQAGSVLGTYAYMAPEQARGQTASVDERCDVFGLGAILCEMLTGSPPYADADREKVRVMALVGDVAGARERLEQCGASEELVALALNCLAPDPQQRPRDAGEVSAAISAHLNGVQERLQRTEVERAAAEVKAAEERKRRRVTVALAAAVLAAVVISAGAYGVIHRQRQERREQSALLVNQALGQAAALQEQASSLAEQPPQAEPLWRDALAAAERAEKTLAAGELDAEAHGRVAAALSDLRSDAAEAKKDKIMWERLERARDLAQELQDSDYVRKRRIEDFIFGLAAAPAYAEAFREYGIDVNVLPPPEAALKIRERPIRSALVAALEAWYYLESTAAGGRLLEIAQAADPDSLRNRVRAAVASGDIVELEQSAADPSATDLPAFTILLVGDVLREHGKHAEAVSLLDRARRRYPQDFWVNDVLGLHYVAADPPDLDEAARCFAAALAIRPASPLGWSNLGAVLTQQGRYAEAVRLLEEGVRLRPDFTTGHQRLVEAWSMQGKYNEALQAAEAGLARRPDSPLIQTTLAGVLQAMGKLDQAEARLRQVLQDDPDWFLAQINLAQVLAQAGRTDEAMRIIDEVQAMRPELTQVHGARGQILLSGGDAAGAVAAYRKAVDLGPAYAELWSALGLALASSGDYAGAVQAYRKAIEIAPGNPIYHGGLGGVLQLEGRWQEAADEISRAVSRMPENAYYHRSLGYALGNLNRFDEAVAEYEKAVELSPQDAGIHAERSFVLFRKNELPGAAEAAHKALEIDPAQAVAVTVLGLIHTSEGKVDEAIREYERALAEKPEAAQVRILFANLLRTQQQWAAAKAEYETLLETNSDSVDALLGAAYVMLQLDETPQARLQRALELAPANSLVHAFTSAHLLRQGKPPEAIESARKAVELSPTSADPQFYLGEALMAQGEIAEALAAFQRGKYFQSTSYSVALPWDDRINAALRRLREGQGVTPK